MEDIFSLGEKWIKTVASSRVLTRSASGRPEVPARAAAAALVARKLATLPPHERVSLSGGAGSIYAARLRGEPPEKLEEVFYEDKFDPVRHLLEHIPAEGVNQGYFDGQVGQRLQQLDVITESLSKQVMEHHEEMVKGMQLVTELERDLQIASIIVKNGRRHLSRSIIEVSRDLIVAANVNKKQVLLDIVPVLERLHQALDIKSRLDSVVDEGDFSKALHMCSECLLLLEECPDLVAVQEMNQSIEEWLQRTIAKVDALLMDVCRKFEAEKYKTVVNAYTLLDDVTSLADKVQSFFAQNVVTETHDVLKNLLFEGEDAQIALKKSRLPYRDLCMLLPEEKFKQVLCKILEVLFDLMCSYHTMMTWHQKPESAEIKPPEDPQQAVLLNRKLQHRRSGSHGDLNQIAKERRHVRTGSLSGMRTGSELFATPMSPTSINASRLLGRSASRRRPGADISETFENGTTSSGELDVRFLEDDGDNNDLVRREEVVTATVARALERGRKTVWELAARRVAALLSNDAVCLSTPHQFLQSLDWVNKFILAGEAFCGAEAASLRTKLTKQSEQYFGAYHCQNLEILRMHVEKELWQPLSSLALKSVNLAGLTGHGASLVRPSVLGENPVSSQGPSSLRAGAQKTSFADWLRLGNPFTEKALHSPVTTRVVDGEAVKVNGVDNGEVMANGGVKVEEEEDDENDDLLADFIDEDSQLPGRLYHDFRKSSNPMEAKNIQGSNEDKQLVLTNSSVNILRYMDKYARLMQILQPIAADVFKGLGQLFELYFFSIFKTFGQREAFGGSRGQESFLLTPQLRATLLRISQGLEAQRLKQSASMGAQPSIPIMGASVGVINSPGTQSDTPLSDVSGGGEIVMAPTNLYAVKERTVATESLACLSQMLKRSRPLLQAMLDQDSLASVEFFYARTIDAVPDLRDHVYKAVARMLLNVGGYVERIASVRWELKDLGMEHNGYVDSLLGAYKQFSTRLGYGGLDKEMHELLLEYGVDTLAETIVEGFSRVRRCNNEGRALMSLDLQVLINGLQHLAPQRLKSNLQVVETYIKAFYLPETEYLHWVRTHPEYTKSQAISLINLVATANNWKRKTRVDIIDRIEAGDL
ncbi:uncharacterized protein [Physcomitrium patens]|uniref:Syndetin C-terminal domain-containing protein n=2 Tax=Physcomitrium patens TaxID=3218 RepID=A0A7I4DRT5_PHYPA|nr:syndetin-like isoform X1 [Physcomitrium patens]XP_024374838.1 syndetin-like isoform X1 [Physcomitrium patens]XP_024374839.1 syndetin-like isoform X1 [Physcomitrium patens]XP_024374840.1 syndetin-like isoform X1 [Physcomitrium patens]XP_024374841.1 syndetin-like isoform X1 [Physcomitrium patens]XP_024374842.1 syndetin-like isoform X1 [Physcomitrium patens]|eukprot:XP_024374837.1 syndetin-like isoform X1 [Physcomitrella patens]